MTTSPLTSPLACGRDPLALGVVSDGAWRPEAYRIHVRICPRCRSDRCQIRGCYRRRFTKKHGLCGAHDKRYRKSGRVEGGPVRDRRQIPAFSEGPIAEKPNR